MSHLPPSSAVITAPRRLRRSPRRGFTLFEAALATVIVGMGVLGIMQLLAVCTQQNRGGSQLTTAMYLAQCIQEATTDLPFNDPSGAGMGREEGGGLLSWNDVDDFHNFTTLGGAPIDARRLALTGLDQYAQTVTVTEVSANNLALALPGADCKRVTVSVTYRRLTTDTPVEVYRTSWVRTR